MTVNLCTCGSTDVHQVMRRSTGDGKDVLLWSDGSITAAFGYGFRGVPVHRAKTPEAAAKWLKIGRLMMGEVCLWSVADLPALYRAAERASKLDGLPGTVRRLMRESKPPPLVWRLLNTDRDGRAVERVAILPRLRWPGMAIWDYCGGPGSAGGRYGLVYRIQGGRADDLSFTDSGFKFRTLAAVWAHLMNTPAP